MCLLALFTVPVQAAMAPALAPNIAYKAQNAPVTIDELIHDSSIKYGVSEPLMRKIIQCESSSDPFAVGDHGQSFGLVQIYLPAHPEVSKAEALDPAFATTFLAKHLASGQGSLWSCYRMVQ